MTIPHKERVVPLVDRLTEEAHATGAVNTITREGKRLVGHNTDVPGFKVALDTLVGKQKMPRQAVVLGAGGGARAVVYGLITEGFQRIIVFNRHLHRAEGAGQALRPERGPHGAAGDALARVDHRGRAGQDEGPHQRDVDRARPTTRAPIPAEIIHADLLVLDLIYARTRLLRDAEAAGAHGRRTAS